MSVKSPSQCQGVYIAGVNLIQRAVASPRVISVIGRPECPSVDSAEPHRQDFAQLPSARARNIPPERQHEQDQGFLKLWSLLAANFDAPSRRPDPAIGVRKHSSSCSFSVPLLQRLQKSEEVVNISLCESLKQLAMRCQRVLQFHFHSIATE